MQLVLSCSHERISKMELFYVTEFTLRCLHAVNYANVLMLRLQWTITSHFPCISAVCASKEAETNRQFASVVSRENTWHQLDNVVHIKQLELLFSVTQNIQFKVCAFVIHFWQHLTMENSFIWQHVNVQIRFRGWQNTFLSIMCRD